MAKEYERSSLQRVREELKRWHGGKINAQTRPGPWWDHPGWENEMAGPAEPHMLAEAIDWTGVSPEMKERILGEWWKPFPEGVTREHELNKIVEAAGGWDNKEATDRLTRSFLDEAASLDYESTKAVSERGGSVIQGDWVQEWDSGYTSYSCQTREGMTEDYNKRYGSWGIHNAYDMLSSSRKHHDKLVTPEATPAKTDYDRMLDDAAERGKYQSQDKSREGPER